MAKQFVGMQNHVVNFSNLVSNIQKCVNEIRVSMVESLVIEADNALRQSPVIKREWHIKKKGRYKSLRDIDGTNRVNSYLITNINPMEAFLIY